MEIKPENIKAAIAGGLCSNAREEAVFLTLSSLLLSMKGNDSNAWGELSDLHKEVNRLWDENANERYIARQEEERLKIQQGEM